MLTDYRIRQRDHLLQIVRALTQQLDLESVLTRILKASTEMLGGRAGLIALRDQPRQTERTNHAADLQYCSHQHRSLSGMTRFTQHSRQPAR